MTAKDRNNWSAEQLEEWAKPALDYPELIRIARTATSNTGAKNLALEFTKERGLEEKVAMACRWLRILRVEHSERFEGLTSQAEQKSKEGKEMGEKVKIEVELDRDLLIQILEEKFGLKVKTCCNCKNLSLGVEGSFGNKLGDSPTYFKGACTKLDPEKAQELSAYGGCNIVFVEDCPDWAQKEVSEKK